MERPNKACSRSIMQGIEVHGNLSRDSRGENVELSVLELVRICTCTYHV